MNSSDLDLGERGKPHNFAPSPDFRWLCEELFEKLDNVRAENKQKISGAKPVTVRYYEILNHFVNLWRKTVGDDIFPALVLILPYRDRRSYNIKDYTLVKAICSYLRLPKNSSTEKRLLRWKKRAAKGVRLSNFCIEEIKKRKKELVITDNISIEKLNTCLDKLHEEHHVKGRGFRGVSESPVFNYCLENMSYLELKYFFDILLKNRVIGGQEHKFLNCWHPDAQDYLSVVSDLKTVAEKLWDPSCRLKSDDLSVNIGYAFLPHLAKKLSIAYEKISRKLGHDFYIEEKMDGERIQLHYMNYGSELKFFSRRGFDYTHLYGDNIQSGSISAFLKLANNVKECVLDGEMVTFDVDRAVVLPFGLVKSSAKNALTTEGICSQSYRPLFMVLDLVYLNGISLTKLPLVKRKEYLCQILTPFPNVVQIIPSLRCSEASSIRNSLQAAVSMGSEGVILKRYDSRYIFGARNDSWIKIKPEYLEQFGENMDLIIIGRTPARKDSLMCGLAVCDGEEDVEGMSAQQEVVNLESEDELIEEAETKKKINKFVSFCVIANGISQEEFREIDKRTRGMWKKSEEISPPPGSIEFGSKIPEEWIDPHDSLVIEVKARSLDNTESSGKRFKAGCTLYGGYCRRIRLDKDWNSCYTLSELYRDRRNKSKSYGDSSNQTLLKPKRLKKNKAEFSLGPKLGMIEDGVQSSQIFEGLYFYVMSDYVDLLNRKRIAKEQLNTYVVKHGGKLINNLISKYHTENFYRVISGKYTAECRVLVERGYDIISPRWILDCINKCSLLEIEPQHCFNVSQDLLHVAQSRVDRFGDSYETTTSEIHLNHLIDSIIKREEFAVKTEASFSNPELNKIPLLMFNGRIFHIPDTFSSDAIHDLEERILLFGGEISSEISSCNVIIIPNVFCDERAQMIKDTRLKVSFLVEKSEKPPAIPYIVTADWVYRSIEMGCQLPEENFNPA